MYKYILILFIFILTSCNYSKNELQDVKENIIENKSNTGFINSGGGVDF